MPYGWPVELSKKELQTFRNDSYRRLVSGYGLAAAKENVTEEQWWAAVNYRAHIMAIEFGEFPIRLST